MECLYVKPWRDYLVQRFRAVEKTLGVKGMYCDELGMSLRARVCYDTGHGHPAPQYMAAGENRMMKELKAALPQTAIYNEFGGTDVGSQFTDGGLSYLTSWNYYSPEWFNVAGNVSYDAIAPHYLDLRRFAFPDLKTFDVMLNQTPWESGNWSLGKMPFFNGNAYYHRFDVGAGADQEAVAMFLKIRELQRLYAAAFSSADVEPLLSTPHPHIFANRFSSAKQDVYTVFNAGFRTASGGLLLVKHTQGATYTDVWQGHPVEVLRVEEGQALLNMRLPPRAVTCIVSTISP